MRKLFLLAIGLGHCPLPGQTYMVTTIAGYIDDFGDGAPATQAGFSAITALATDAAGNVYVADDGRIHKIVPGGGTRTIAGFGVPGNSGDGGPAIFATTSPNDIAVGPDGVIYISEAKSPRIRKVQADGTILTVALPGSPFGSVFVAVNGTGDLFISDSGRVRKLTPDGRIASVAAFSYSTGGLTIDRDGNLFVVLIGPAQVWRIDDQGNQTLVAGGGQRVQDGVPAIQSALENPTRVAVDLAGNLYITGRNGLRKVDRNGIITTLRSTENPDEPYCCLVATDSSNAVYTTKPIYTDYNRVWRITPDGIMHAFAGGGIGDGGPAIRAFLSRSLALAMNGDGELHIADSGNNRIRKMDKYGVISTVAGTGVAGFSGDGGQANQAMLNGPGGVDFDAAGNMYISDTSNHRIRKVDRAGYISTIAGTGVGGYTGDGMPAIASAVNYPGKIIFDKSGTPHFVDSRNHLVRKITSTGILSTVAGNGVDIGCCLPVTVPIGDGGPATQAILQLPNAIVFDPAGNLYIAEIYGRIRKVTPNGSIITSFNVKGLNCLAIDSQGNFYVSEYNSITKINPAGERTRLAGSDTNGNDAFGVPSLEAVFGYVFDLLLDGNGHVLFTDNQSGTQSYIRRLEPASIFPARVYNQASLRQDFLSPGEIVSISWADREHVTNVAAAPGSDGRFPTTLAGTRVLFNGIAAPVLKIDSGEVIAVVPYSLAGAPGTFLQLEYLGKLSNAIAVPLRPTSPGIFTFPPGTTQAAALNEDFTTNSPSRRAGKGAVVMLFATGAGVLSPSVQDGTVVRDALSKPVHPLAVQIDGVDAEVTYAGTAPGLIAGVLQVNVRVPRTVRSGVLPVVLTIAGAESQPRVTVSIE